MIVYHGTTEKIIYPDIEHSKKYLDFLEQDIIAYLAKVCSLDVRKAFDIYYSSKLSEQIAQGLYGIENMDYKYLVQDLIENESELFNLSK